MKKVNPKKIITISEQFVWKYLYWGTGKTPLVNNLANHLKKKIRLLLLKKIIFLTKMKKRC